LLRLNRTTLVEKMKKAARALPHHPHH
jgi:hypothetical protein